jgi:hypothetical protein
VCHDITINLPGLLNTSTAGMQPFLLLFALATVVVSKPADETDQTLLWGPYRPNLYFGIRPRLPHSLVTGLIWFSTLNYQSVQSAFVTLATTPRCPYIHCPVSRI